jgi:hypothetical protein
MKRILFLALACTAAFGPGCSSTTDDTSPANDAGGTSPTGADAGGDTAPDAGGSLGAATDAAADAGASDTGTNDGGASTCGPAPTHASCTAAKFSLAPGTLYPVSKQYSLFTGAVADMNCDGKADLVLSGLSGMAASAVGIRLNNGDGTFAAEKDYPVNIANDDVQKVGTGDLDGDGLPDVVSWGLTGGGGLRFQSNDGKGGLGPAQGLPLSAAQPDLTILTVVDLNGDGINDIFSSSSGATVLLNAGKATFAGAVTFTTGGQKLESEALGDLNGDGAPDVAVSDVQGNLQILLNDGHGVFSTPATTPAGNLFGMFNFGQVAIGDFDGDGKGDVALVWENTLDILLGKGDGTLATPITSMIASAIQSPEFTQVVAADFNGDGKSDLAMTDTAADNGGFLFLAQGGGQFAASTPFPLDDVANELLPGDFKGDGVLGLAIVGVSTGIELLPGACQ